jgi:predicted outer membrane lipoprotein
MRRGATQSLSLDTFGSSISGLRLWYWSQKYLRTMTGLHLAAYFGIQEAVAYFIHHQYPSFNLWLVFQKLYHARMQIFGCSHMISPIACRIGQKYLRTMTGLHLAAYFGIQEAVAYFIHHQYPMDLQPLAGLSETLSRQDANLWLLSHDLPNSVPHRSTFETFGSGVCESDTAMDERFQSHPLYSYAARYWGIGVQWM